MAEERAPERATRRRKRAGNSEAKAAAAPSAPVEAEQARPAAVKASAVDRAMAPTKKRDPVEEDRLARQQVFRILLATAAVMIVAMIIAGIEFGPPAVVLLLTAMTLVGVIAAFWNSIRTLIGETRLSGADAFAIGSPRAEEEQKRAVLRAMKDLEFERSVGKISEEDYALLVTRYREEAKRLLRQIDLASAEQRERAESIVEARLRDAGVVVPAQVPAFEPMPEPAKAEPEAKAEEAEAAPEEKPEEPKAETKVDETPSEEPRREG